MARINVNKKNFEASLTRLEQQLANKSGKHAPCFVAIDCEFTGLKLPYEKQHSRQSASSSLHLALKRADAYSLCQLGLAVFCSAHDSHNRLLPTIYTIDVFTDDKAKSGGGAADFDDGAFLFDESAFWFVFFCSFFCLRTLLFEK